MREQALQQLRNVFGYGEFRGQQADIIDQVACGGDALVLMPVVASHCAIRCPGCCVRG